MSCVYFLAQFDLKAIHGVTELAIWLVVSWMPLARRAAVR